MVHRGHRKRAGGSVAAAAMPQGWEEGLIRDLGRSAAAPVGEGLGRRELAEGLSLNCSHGWRYAPGGCWAVDADSVAAVDRSDARGTVARGRQRQPLTTRRGPD